MINVDISNIWGEVALPELLAIESEAAAAHEMLLEGTGAGSQCREWLDFSSRQQHPEMFRILLAAEQIRKDSDVCVVVGIGGSDLGARAAIELLQGPNHNLGKGKGNPRILFAGNSLSTRHWNEGMQLLKDQDFSVIVISRFGTDLESAIAFRSLRWMLERKYGTEAARKRIYAVTDPEEGALRQMVREEGWESFSIPSGAEGGFSVLTPAGLLPMAVAGIDIQDVMQGAADARKEYAMGSFENPVWQYAAVRNLLYRGGKAVELLEAFEPGFRIFGAWWQQLFGAAAGTGLFPATAVLTGDLYSLGQLIQGGKRNLFETILRFDPPENKMTIGSDWKNLDGLNALEGKTLDFVEEQAFQGILSAHADSGVPVIVVDCGVLNDRKVGELFCFMELSCGISAYLLGVDPFRQPGAAGYQQNMHPMQAKTDTP